METYQLCALLYSGAAAPLFLHANVYFFMIELAQETCYCSASLHSLSVVTTVLDLLQRSPVNCNLNKISLLGLARNRSHEKLQAHDQLQAKEDQTRYRHTIVTKEGSVQHMMMATSEHQQLGKTGFKPQRCGDCR
jgi:hypothetical protein